MANIHDKVASELCGEIVAHFLSRFFFTAVEALQEGLQYLFFKLEEFPRGQKLVKDVKHDKLYHREVLKDLMALRKVLLNNFHLKGRTLGFHPQTRKVEPLLYSITDGFTEKYCSIV